MKISAKIKLLPTAAQAAALLATLHRCNECANWASHESWERQVFGFFSLIKLLYHEGRKRYGLNSQLTVMVLSKVADAYKLDKKRERTFGPKGAIAFDDRILSFRKDSTVNIWTLEGRQTIPYVAGPRQIEQLKQRQGQSDLIHHRGKWFLSVICNVEEPTLREVDEFLGIDMGVANIASDSDGGNYSGDTIKGVRFRHRRLRTKLQKKQTRGTRRKLRELSGREYRFASDTNHCISKQIVAKAQGTGRGIAVEDLRYIRTRITARREQRAVLHSWSFAQLRTFLEYKARLAGIPLVTVDPRNSSRECSKCGHIAKSNRPSQSVFRCGSCGHESNADLNASRVIAGRACADRPNVSQHTAEAS